MIYYGNYNEKGKYIGFYTKEINKDNIPQPTVELSEQQWIEALSGEYKVVEGKHTKGRVEEEVDIVSIRQIRNEKLAESDWTQLPDSPLSEEKKLEWKNYRQMLRDITKKSPMNFDLINKPA